MLEQKTHLLTPAFLPTATSPLTLFREKSALLAESPASVGATNACVRGAAASRSSKGPTSAVSFILPNLRVYLSRFSAF